MKFTKMNGTGNDFIIINNTLESISLEKIPAIAKKLCHRRLSIGADGFMVVDKAEKGGDFKMTFFNSDGSIGEMCGNGARCIARYGFEHGFAGEEQKIETTAGLVIGKKLDKRNYTVRLNDPTKVAREMDIEIDGKKMTVGYVELGDPFIPHAVVEIPGLADYPENELRELGRKIRFCEAFPKGANVNFFEIIGENTVLEKTYERGVEDFTMACGTGSGSLGLILTMRGLVSGKKIKIEIPGGELIIDAEFDEDHNFKNLFLTGLTNVVAVGEVMDEELEF